MLAYVLLTFNACLLLHVTLLFRFYRLTITYIRAKQFIVGALPQPHGFSSFKADFTAKGTARWSQLLDAEDVLVQQMLFRFSELESLELVRQATPLLGGCR